LDGGERLLELVIDLGNRMLPVFDTPLDIPYRLVNLSTSKAGGEGMGSMMLEYGLLSKLTGDLKYLGSRMERAL
jgi:mannosidase alpha-like ER degradation enhancer 2